MIEAIIRIKVVPRSAKNEFMIENDQIKVKLTAPPVEGKANKALQQFLAKALGISRSSIEIISGEKAREKRIRISGLSQEDVEERFLRG